MKINDVISELRTLREEMRSREKSMENRLNQLDAELRSSSRSMEKRFNELDEKFEQQSRTFRAQESFPVYPRDLRPTSAFRVIDTHSCSKPITRKIGYSG